MRSTTLEEEHLKLSFGLDTYTHTYTYIEGERERDREIFIFFTGLKLLVINDNLELLKFLLAHLYSSTVISA